VETVYLTPASCNLFEIRHGNTYMLELSESPTFYKAKEWCAVESVLRHTNRPLVLLARNKSFYLDELGRALYHKYEDLMDLLSLDDETIDNLFPSQHVNFSEDWRHWYNFTVKRMSTRSDFLRYALLYKYGGVYIDTDVIVRKNLTELKFNNTIGLQDGGSTLNTAVLAFENGSYFLEDVLSNIQRL
jgi:hypothetical protein